jgi:hypothetical protein
MHNSCVFLTIVADNFGHYIRGKKFTTHRYGWVTPKRYTQPNATVGPRNWAANKISQPFFAFTPLGGKSKEHHSNVYTLQATHRNMINKNFKWIEKEASLL